MLKFHGNTAVLPFPICAAKMSPEQRLLIILGSPQCYSIIFYTSVENCVLSPEIWQLCVIMFLGPTSVCIFYSLACSTKEVYYTTQPSLYEHSDLADSIGGLV